MGGNSPVVTPISPSFVSTDLLTPHQRDRITIPSVGYHAVEHRPIGGKTWGTNLTKYGGIGKLPFLGKTRARDLYVTRNLKHFGSGFSQYKAEIQPYQLTSLMKSACRVNDQTVPTPFTLELDPRIKLDYNEFRKRDPYFTHKYLFEVFPSHDPERTFLPGNIPMTERTRQDLRKKYDSIYRTHRYSSFFPDHSDVMRERAKRETIAQQITELPSDITNKASNQNCCTKRAVDYYSSSNNFENANSYQETPLNASLVADMSPVCYVLSQIGQDIRMFTAKDVLGLVSQYYGSVAVDVLVTRITAAIGSDQEMQYLIRAIGENGSFFFDQILPFVKAVILEGSSIHDIIMGKLKEPDMKPKEEKPKAVDAHKQYPTLRSFIMGTNATSFDHTLAHMKKKEREPSVVGGIAPVWPPSGHYVLNKQKMKLETFDSYPRNCAGNCTCTHCTSPLPSIQTSPWANSERGPESPSTENLDKSKKVRFSDTVLAYEYDSATNRDHSQDDMALPPSGLQWYKKYMDSILPHPGTPPGQLEPPVTNQVVPPIGKYTSSSDSDREVAVPSILCRYPPSHPSLIRGDWRTKSIVDPNQHLKTLAQRRYHLLHPDPVPDLRENHNFSQKYFFHGYHTSTFRG